MYSNQLSELIYDAILYKDQVYGIKVLWAGIGAGTWCKGNGRTRAGGDSCTKSKRPDLEKGGVTWCKGDGGTRAGADSCTKSKRPDLKKGGKTWCKGDGGIRAGGDSCTKSERPDFEKSGGTWCKGDGGTRAGGDSCTKSKRLGEEKGGVTWCKGDGRTRAGGDSCTKSGLCPYNGVNSKIVLYLFLGGTALSGIKKSNLNLTMSKSMLGCASQAGTSGESATCHLAAA